MTLSQVNSFKWALGSKSRRTTINTGVAAHYTSYLIGGIPVTFVRQAGDKTSSVDKTRQVSPNSPMLCSEAYELSLRRELRKSERSFASSSTNKSLRVVEKDRSALAEYLYSQGKVMEGDSLLIDCIRDEERLGRLKEQNIDGLYTQWRQMGLRHNKNTILTKTIRNNALKTNSEITKFGVGAKDWLIKSIHSNRVLAVGEEHTQNRGNSQREFIADMMLDLKAAGATHLAIEFPSERQYMLDDFLKNGNWNKSLSTEGQKLMSEVQISEDLQRVVLSAHSAGLKVTPVDSEEIIKQGQTAALLGSSRDQYMAVKIADLLKFDKKARVVFYGGAHHCATRPKETWHDSTAEILRRKEFKVASAYSQIPQSLDTNAPLYQATGFVDHAVAVPTKSAKNIGRLPEDLQFNPHQQMLNAWDVVLIYPQEKK